MLGISCIVEVGDGEALGVGDGIGIPCRCCASTDATNSNPSTKVSPIRVSGWDKDVSLASVSDINAS